MMESGGDALYCASHKISLDENVAMRHLSSAQTARPAPVRQIPETPMATAADTAAKDTIKTADKMKATADQYANTGAKAFKDGVEKSLAGFTEMNAQAKHNVEAMVASATATAKGAEALGSQAMEYGKAAVEKHVEAAKALSSARSMQEMLELQTAYAKSSMEAYMAHMNRASETFSATLKEAFRPLNQRTNAMVETMQAAR
jgi:phasin family protein